MNANQSMHAQTIITPCFTACDYQRIHAQTMVTFVFQEHTQSIHAQTMITFVFQEHTLARASMLKP